MQFIGYFKKAWQVFVSLLGLLSTKIFLMLIFFLLGIIAVFLKVFRKDLLDCKFKDRESYWRVKEKISHSIEQAKHQF